MQSPRWIILAGMAAVLICLDPVHRQGARACAADSAGPSSHSSAGGVIHETAKTEVQPCQRFSDHRNGVRSQRFRLSRCGTEDSAQQRERNIAGIATRIHAEILRYVSPKARPMKWWFTQKDLRIKPVRWMRRQA